MSDRHENWTRGVSFLLAAGVLSAGTGVSPLARAAAPNVVRIGATTRSSELAALPPSQVLELPHGSRMTVADLRSLAPLAARLRSMTGRGVLRQPLSGRTLPVTPQIDLRQLESAPDATVLQLPDGRRMTAGQFKAVLPHVRKAGATVAGRSATRAVVKVARGTPLAELLKHPDSDVLESPGGKRVTVGELRRLAQSLPPAIRR